MTLFNNGFSPNTMESEKRERVRGDWHINWAAFASVIDMLAAENEYSSKYYSIGKNMSIALYRIVTVSGGRGEAESNIFINLIAVRVCVCVRKLSWQRERGIWIARGIYS